MQTSSHSSCVLHENGNCSYCITLLKGMAPVNVNFDFFGNFDSANLGNVELIQYCAHTSDNTTGRSTPLEIPDVEFRICTKPDCFGTEFQNSNRTWFNFAMQANVAGLLVKLNLVDLNRQTKMYSQGMCPVYRIVPGKLNWERIRDKPSYTVDENMFSISFKYRTPENLQSVVYFAFTYPFSYEDLNSALVDIDARFLNAEVKSKDDIYYARETVCLSLDGRNIDLITISSYHNISSERETRLKFLFPDLQVPRPFRFIDKKVIFVSARVHPGETPSSFVFNGLLKLLLNRDDIVAVTLRRLYVFKMMPMLNPDGVARGHYRTDTRGVNLNRMYLNPSSTYHPSIYAARALIRYYHFGYEKTDEPYESVDDFGHEVDEDDLSSVDDHSGPVRDNILSKKVSHMTLEENKKNVSKLDTWCSKCKRNNTQTEISKNVPFSKYNINLSIGCRHCGIVVNNRQTCEATDNSNQHNCKYGDYVNESGIYMYIDMHGHASKKGIFMYGNHFEDMEKNIECMLLPKIMSINNYNFHFSACNFTERNMYLKDRRDGMSREGCGRVAVLKLTGLIYSYTLECNYNTGRIVNALPSTIKETGAKALHTIPVPPKYTPHTFEQVGRALAASILDLTGNNPITRLPNSNFHTLNGLREYLHSQCSNELCVTRFPASRCKVRNTTNLQAQGTNVRGVLLKSRSSSGKVPKRMAKTMRSANIPIERKENICTRNDRSNSKPGCSTNKLTVTSINNMPKTSNAIKNKFDKEVGSTLKLTDTAKRTKQDGSTLEVGKEKQSIGASEPSSSRIQLKEICFVKGTEGKRMIAKYKTKGSGNKKESQDNLVVSWDTTNNPQVFSYKTRGPGIPDLKPLVAPGSSKVGCFRVHNFAKSATKIKKKRPLRRLTATIDTPAKSELKKRKIFKSSSAT